MGRTLTVKLTKREIEALNHPKDRGGFGGLEKKLLRHIDKHGVLTITDEELIDQLLHYYESRYCPGGWEDRIDFVGRALIIGKDSRPKQAPLFDEPAPKPATPWD